MPVSEEQPARSEPAIPAAGSRWWRIARRTVRAFEHLLAALALVGLLLVALPIPRPILDAIDRQDPLAPADTIICLGGEPARILEAARLLQEGHARRLVVSNNGEAAELMRQTAIEWGAPPDRVIVDDRARTTRDHPASVRRAAGLDPARDRCIIVTSATHLARSRACFEKAGYRHIILREPRWERQWRLRVERNWKWRFRILPELIYEGAAWAEYWLRGAV